LKQIKLEQKNESLTNIENPTRTKLMDAANNIMYVWTES